MKRGNNPYDSLVSFISRCNISTREEVRLREIISDIKKFDESASLPQSSTEEEKDDDDGWIYCPNCGRVKAEQ